MITAPLVVQIVSIAGPLVLGYLLRHWGVKLPGLPSPAAPPASPVVPAAPLAASDHVGLLSQVLNIAKPEAEKLLQAAMRDVLAKGLADLKANAAK